jgi:A/G-specific adenine glycosylase
MKKLGNALLQWYRAEGLPYPWRQTSDPYRVWLSEILLQQTRIPVALRYYEKILQSFPSLESLVDAREEKFLSLWSGVGYYSRARNMLRCAREIHERFGGKFPDDYDSLRSLPGIGRYTAGALRNICFERLTPAIDGNIGRVLARLTDNRSSMQSSEYVRAVEKTYTDFASQLKPSEFFQAMMELGERICLPEPRCPKCPVRSFCLAANKDTASSIPVRRPKKATEEHYWHLLVLRKNGCSFYALNASRGFLQDAWLFPDLLNRRKLSDADLQQEFQKKWKIEVSKIRGVGRIRHTVTFRKILVCIYTADSFRIANGTGRWIQDHELSEVHTSSVTAKVFAALAASPELSIQNDPATAGNKKAENRRRYSSSRQSV